MGCGNSKSTLNVVESTIEDKPKESKSALAVADSNTTTANTVVSNKKESGYCYFFGLDVQSKANLTEGNRDMKELLGGKGANLCEMCNLSINVPPGFTVSTSACEFFSKHNNISSVPTNETSESKPASTKASQLPEEIKKEVDEYLKKLETTTGKKFGDSQEGEERVLLLSVRSGAAISMPGMMDTVLDLGICDKNIHQLVKNFGDNERSAWDSYRSLVQIYGEVVLGVKQELFEENIKKQKEKREITLDTELNLEEIQQIVQDHKLTIFEQTGGEEFPQDVHQQLYRAITAVFDSWHNKRAVQYRKIHNITGLKGTAVNIQSMVFGNLDERSASGVCFSRNPSTGENLFYGEYMIQAQGEAIVAGQRTPEKIETLAQNFPECFTQLKEISGKLEKHFKDVQDMEFTIEQGVLFMLQCRNGKKTINASLKIYCDMIDEGLINEREALLKIDASQLSQMLHPYLDEAERKTVEPLATGLPASPGCVVGRIAFTSEQAVKMSEKRKELGDVILVREQTSTEDLAGMHASQGFLTTNGGLTSHAAVVSRQQGKCCVSGCSLLYVTEDSCTINGTIFKEGDIITIDGSTGAVYGQALKTSKPGISQPDFVRIMDIEKKYRTMGVYANADSSADAKKAMEFGSEGIGLCRTEHMFFEKTRIIDMRKMIVASTPEKRQEAINTLKEYQRSDFLSLFHEMGNRKVTIRLLDPPLHEFLPEEAEEIEQLAQALEEDVKEVTHTVTQLKEKNPMLGHRGCRLGITFPEITIMQVEAIFEAAFEGANKNEVKVDIMVPLIASVQEFQDQKDIIESVATKMFGTNEHKKNLVHYRVGCMIETPRAVLMSKEIAAVADFFSIGSNDLTQMTFGFSRDDSGKFLKKYLEKDLLESDPFEILDQDGVGKCIQLSVHNGREVKSGFTVGLCGEHGGESHSVKFLHKCGLSYVSCSPYRIPIARLSAAQESVKQWRNVIAVSGGPGSGKGTQCEKLVQKYGCIHYSAGDLLRAEASKDTEEGKMISSFIKEGKIVPGSVTLSLLKKAILDHPNKDATFLVDGFPREMTQAVDFEQFVCKFKFVLFFDCPEDILEKRLLERGKTSGRSDDNLESIKKRFKTYIDQTKPVIEYFKKTDRVRTMDSSKTADEVFAEVCKLFD